MCLTPHPRDRASMCACVCECFHSTPVTMPMCCVCVCAPVCACTCARMSLCVPRPCDHTRARVFCLHPPSASAHYHPKSSQSSVFCVHYHLEPRQNMS